MKRLLHAVGVRRIFFFYAMLLAVLMMLLSFALIRESERSLVEYTLLQAQKTSEVLQTAINQAAGQIQAAYAVLRRSEGFDAVLQADRHSQITYQTAKDYSDAIAFSSGLPSGAVVSLSTPLMSVSPYFSPPELAELDALMPDTHNAAFITTRAPDYPVRATDQLTFGFSYFSNGSRVGSIYISLELPSLTAKLSLPQQEGLYFILTDQWQNLVFLDAADLAPETRERIWNDVFAEDPAAPRGDSRYVVNASKMSGTGCTLYSVTDTAAARAPLRSIYLYTLSILLVLLAVGVVGNRYLHQTVIIPLDALGRYITELRQKENVLLEQAPPALPPGGCAEIESIKGEFYALLASINRLSLEVQRQSEDLYQAELLRKNIEIEQLRSQINPHFLYNTLELIRADAIEGRIDQVSSITAAMGKLYRYSIKGEPIVPLREEVECVKAYLRIQQQRFGERVAVLYSISPEACAVPIPKMLLQPLVENAIVHGIEPAGGGTLFIGASVKAGTLAISVRDDGVGIPEDQLEALQARLKSHDRSSDHVGLANVSTRMYLQYGGRCSFHISSRPGDGTSITMQMPSSFFAPQAQKNAGP